jgi:parvulin-like peptidyl-prolyl isomerase
VALLPRRSALLPLVLTAALLGPAAAHAAGGTKPVTITGKVAAIVNGHPVPVAIFRLFFDLVHNNPQAKTMSIKQQTAQAMKDVVADGILQQYADAHHITVTAADLRKQLANDQARAGGAAQLKAQVAQAGLTDADYKQFNMISALELKVEQAVAPAPYTDKQALSKANQLVHQLQHGGNFAALAKKYSNDPGSAQKGGNLGLVYPNQMVAPFDHASFHAPIGKYVVVHSQYGYHVVQVTWRGKALPPGNGSKVKVQAARVRHILLSTQPDQNRFHTWLQAQEQKAKVKQIVQVTG